MKTTKKTTKPGLSASVSLVVESAVLSLNPSPEPSVRDTKEPANAKGSDREQSEKFREEILKRYEVPYAWNPGG